jgi:hypothetical protein
VNEQRLHTPWQQKVFTKLLGLQYKIIYKKGIENAVADAISHKSGTSVTCMAISSCQPQWLDELEASYEQDLYATDIIAKLTLHELVVSHFSRSQGVLHYKKRIWVGADSALQLKLIIDFHESASDGHSGVPVTYRRLKQYFSWKGMKAVVHDFVQSCVICQMAKLDRSKYPSLLQPLPVPDEAWQVITMDFMRDCHFLGQQIAFWSLLISSLSLPIFFLLRILIQQHLWLEFSWTMCINCMAYLLQKCLTEIKCLLDISGECCSIWPKFSLG